MKPGIHAHATASESVTGHRFDRLIIFYRDADGLRRGFQFWMAWQAGAQRGCDCIPVYLGQRQPNSGVAKILRNPCPKALVLFCPAANAGAFADFPQSIYEVLQQDRSMQRCLVVLFTGRQSISRDTRAGKLSEQWFALGTFLAFPRRATGKRRDSTTGCRLHDLMPVMETMEPGTGRRTS